MLSESLNSIYSVTKPSKTRVLSDKIVIAQDFFDTKISKVHLPRLGRINDDFQTINPVPSD